MIWNVGKMDKEKLIIAVWIKHDLFDNAMATLREFWNCERLYGTNWKTSEKFCSILYISFSWFVLQLRTSTFYLSNNQVASLVDQLLLTREFDSHKVRCIRVFIQPHSPWTWCDMKTIIKLVWIQSFPSILVA